MTPRKNFLFSQQQPVVAVVVMAVAGMAAVVMEVAGVAHMN